EGAGAYLMVDMAHFAGLVAAGLHPSPVPHAHMITSTTHKTLGGPRGGFILATAELGKKFSSSVFPGQQGGPLEHVIAAKAVAFKLAAEAAFRERQERTLAPPCAPNGGGPGPPARPASRGSGAAPPPTGCGWPGGSRRGTAGRPRPGCTRPASRSTATRSPSTPARRW